MSKQNPSPNVALFPPLPRVPSPPRFPPDARQRQTSRILGHIARAVQSEMVVAGPNLVKGFPASAVDLGRLKDALERGVQRLDATQVADRWDEVFAWMRRVIAAWVQRYKMLKIERLESGIRVEMQTQDDYGYYDYAFDVFPKRNATISKERRPAL
jgi:hypothetical protein